MYLARFSYAVAPADRRRAIELIRREAAAAEAGGMRARLLVPLTRGPGGAALQFEIELASLDGLERFRECGLGSSEDTREWMSTFNGILLFPPEVELLRIDGGD